MVEIKWKRKIFFGTDSHGNRIYLSPPEWCCGWYWSFGYLGNRDCHYHLMDYANGRNINMYDALTVDYTLNPIIKDNLWDFCELSATAYTLKRMSNLLYLGGSHYTTNKCADVIKNDDEYSRINRVVLPEIFNTIHSIIYS